ncbi:MAG: phosphatase PAP2 family protein [Flavobacteriales bacterium]|nr:phosphatase PAP2 family protein [Flavobacteriales bacterium]MEB2341537.1 phosphatase PAP2 family protein [Flavobacteriia bacterium]
MAVNTRRNAGQDSLRAFLLTGLLLLLPAVVAHWRMGRFALHTALNGFHTGLGDAVFPWITWLASGWLAVALSLALLWRSWRSFLMMALATGLSALVVQWLKRRVFEEFDRPSMFLEHMPGLPLVGGVELHHYFSFPSGHTTAAFSMCLALAVIIGRRGAAILLAVLAVLLGYSRVYLSQHFAEDVVAGAFTGSLVAVAVYLVLYHGRLGRNTRLDASPLRGGQNQ